MLGRVLGKVWDEMAPMAEAGAHEMASALFRGDAFVMYGHSGKDTAEPPSAIDALLASAKEQQPEPPIERQQDRGGRE